MVLVSIRNQGSGGGGGGGVTSVNGQTGVVTLDAANVGAVPDSKVIRFVSLTDSSTITGTTGVTLMRSCLVPAGTVPTNATVSIRIRQRVRKSGSGGTAVMGIYVHTLNQVSGATVLGVYTTPAATFAFNQMKRDFFVKSATVTEGFPALTSAATDDIAVLGTVTSSNINWAVNQYLIFSINPNSSADSFVNSGYIIEFIIDYN